MSHAQSQPETVILRMLLPDLEADGFRVFLHPARTLLPSFMQGYQTGAIAMKEDKKVAIEVKSGSGRAEPPIQKLQEMFSSHPDWELRVVYAPAANADQPIAPPPRHLLVENLDRLLKILEDAGPVPALLTGWSVFEAAARSLIPDTLGRPQTPGRLLERLASDGYITPEEADGLRNLGRLRNDAAHGQLDAVVTRDQLENLVGIIRTLLTLSDEGARQ